MPNIKLFESKKIRSVWNETEQKWYFTVVDVIEEVTYSEKRVDY
ncbi:MAG: phage antirepressor protein [bacterium]